MGFEIKSREQLEDEKLNVEVYRDRGTKSRPKDLVIL